MSSNYKDAMRLNGEGLKGKRMKRWFRSMWSNPKENSIEKRLYIKRYVTKPFNVKFNKALLLSKRYFYNSSTFLPF